MRIIFKREEVSGFRVQGSGFRVQGCGASFAAIYNMGRYPKVSG